jgi:hypothetical protein
MIYKGLPFTRHFFYLARAAAVEEHFTIGLHYPTRMSQLFDCLMYPE